MTTGIYGIFLEDTDECLYVGQSTDIEIRWSHHRLDLAQGKHHNKLFQIYYDEFEPKLVSAH